MQEIVACDSYGNSLTNLVQWDKDVYVYLSAEEINSAYRTHFFNNTMDEALVVESEYNSGTLKVKIPNTLLTQPYIIIGYVNVIKNGETKSLYGFKINVRKKPKPSNYVHIDSKEWIEVETVLDECRSYADAAFQSAKNAWQSEINSATFATESADSAANSKDSEEAASKSAENAKQSEENAKEYASETYENAEIATQKAIEANTSAQKADLSEKNAANSALESIQSANAALQSERNAETYASDAESSANQSENYSLLSKSYAIGEGKKRENEATDNAKYYCEQSKTNVDTAIDAAQEAEQSKEYAEEYANSAADSASDASNSLVSAEQSAQEALESAIKAERISESIQNMSRWTNTIIDDVTKTSYFIGIENGVVYFCDEFE